jgi:heme exporter protein C
MRSAPARAGPGLLLGALTLLAVALAIVTLYGAYFYAAREREMGDIQRIFYFHAPAGLACFLAFFVTFVCGIGYLVTRRPAWDVTGHASAEIGLLFCTIVLFTGPFWARPVWGRWWTWEARLTTTLILFLIYSGYLLVRRYTDDPEQQARFAAVIGIVGFLDVPLVYWSVRFFRGHHPLVLKVSGGGGLEESMRHVFLAGIATYLALYVCLMLLRTRLGRAEVELRWLAERAARNARAARIAPAGRAAPSPQGDMS